MDRRENSPAWIYWQAIRRRWKILVGAALLVPVVATLFAVARPNVYEARSSVLIARQSLANQLTGTVDIGLQQQSFDQVLQTQAKLARTATVVEATLGTAAGTGQDPEGFRDDSSVVVAANSDLLNFSVRSRDPGLAQELSIAYAQAYVAYRTKLDSVALERARDDLQDAIGAARKQGRSGANLVSRLAASMQDLETRMALQSSNAQVVERAQAATKIAPRPKRDAAIGLLVGILLGLVLIWARETFDTRVRSGDETEAILRAPVLGRVREPSSDTEALTMLSDPHGATAEAFRVLRANLTFGVRARDAKVVAVTSSMQGEGKSTTIANLAIAAAMSGKTVALVDIDLRRPRVAQLFGVPAHPGVTDIGLGDALVGDARNAIQLPVSSNIRGGVLHVIPAGAVPPDPGEFVTAPAIGRMMEALRNEYDMVFVDGPPAGLSDTSAVLGYSDAVFVCVRLGLVKRPMLREIKKRLDQFTVPLLGVVVTNAAADETASYYGYGVYDVEYGVPADAETTGVKRADALPAEPSVSGPPQ